MIEHGVIATQMRVVCGGYLCRDTLTMRFNANRIDSLASKTLKDEGWKLIVGLWYCKECQ